MEGEPTPNPEKLLDYARSLEDNESDTRHWIQAILDAYDADPSKVSSFTVKELEVLCMKQRITDERFSALTVDALQHVLEPTPVEDPHRALEKLSGWFGQHPPQPLTPDERDTDDWEPLGGLEE